MEHYVPQGAAPARGYGDRSADAGSLDSGRYFRGYRYESAMYGDYELGGGLRGGQKATWRWSRPGEIPRGPHAGRGPRGYRRSDERIHEDVNDHLTEHPQLDATDVEVRVQHGEVTLRGQVSDRRQKRLAEDLAERVFGVRDVHNELRLTPSRPA